MEENHSPRKFECQDKKPPNLKREYDSLKGILLSVGLESLGLFIISFTLPSGYPNQGLGHHCAIVYIGGNTENGLPKIAQTM